MLEKPNIDTGMGLERLACVMQGVGNLFEVDTVNNILKHVESITNKKYGENESVDISIRVITDHIRSTVFMVSDGVLPSNEGRGYVLRRLLRRAARHGRILGVTKPFLQKLCATVIQENLTAYPELNENADYIKKVIFAEEERFLKTIDQGLSILTSMLSECKASSNGKKPVLNGKDVFKLHDTFGFPLDLTREIASENGVDIDEGEFRIELKKQQDTARKDRASRDIGGWAQDLFSEVNCEATQFVGYDTLECETSVVALSDGEDVVQAVSVDDGEKQGVLLILEKTPFYAESGGQVADTGTIKTLKGNCELVVNACKKTGKGYFVHTCTLKSGTLKAKDKILACVDEKRRGLIMRNHTSVHLLQAALREVLGSHVHQAGSYVDDERSRFDFTHFSSVTPKELAAVEKLVNEKIFMALPVTVQEMTLQQAKELGAIALFGEKYGEIVRVVDTSGFSVEFCGGTHVSNVSHLGVFKILSESSVAAGIRRIEATTGLGVLKLLDEKSEILSAVANVLKASALNDLPPKAAALASDLKTAEREVSELKAEIAAKKIDGIFENAQLVGETRIFTMFLTGTAPDALRNLCDRIKDRAPKGIIAIIGESDGKHTLCVACGKLAIEMGLSAGKLVKEIATIAGGNGGGKPDFAMAGIKDASKIDEALSAVPTIVKKFLGI